MAGGDCLSPRAEPSGRGLAVVTAGHSARASPPLGARFGAWRNDNRE